MLICPKRKIAFFKPMKSAGSSVESALAVDLNEAGFCVGDKDPLTDEWVTQSRGDNIHNFHSHAWPQLLFETESYRGDYKSITVARNPFDTAVSYYWYLVLNNQDNPDVRLNTVSAEDSPVDIQRKFEALMLTPDPGDGDLLMHRLGVESEKLCPLVYLSCINIQFFDRRINYFLKYEKLAQDFSDLCHHLEIRCNDLPRHKSYPGRLRDFHFSEYHTTETKGIIENYFSDVNEVFGYRC